MRLWAQVVGSTLAGIKINRLSVDQITLKRVSRGSDNFKLPAWVWCERLGSAVGCSPRPPNQSALIITSAIERHNTAMGRERTPSRCDYQSLRLCDLLSRIDGSNMQRRAKRPDRMLSDDGKMLSILKSPNPLLTQGPRPTSIQVFHRHQLRS